MACRRCAARSATGNANFDPGRMPGHPRMASRATRNGAGKERRSPRSAPRSRIPPATAAASVEDLIHHIGEDTLVGWAWAVPAMAGSRRPARRRKLVIWWRRGCSTGPCARTNPRPTLPYPARLSRRSFLHKSSLATALLAPSVVGLAIERSRSADETAMESDRVTPAEPAPAVFRALPSPRVNRSFNRRSGAPRMVSCKPACALATATKTSAAIACRCAPMKGQSPARL